MSTALKSSPVQELLFFDIHAYLKSLLSDIHQAKESVDLEVYCLTQDEIGKQVIDALEKARKRGVKVRLLIDGIGSWGWPMDLLKAIRDAGIELKVYHSLPWIRWQWNHARVKYSFFKKFFYLLGVLNKRNHRKICLIDSHVLYLGSINLTKSHCGDKIKNQPWRDATVRIENLDFSILKDCFDTHFNHQGLIKRKMNWHNFESEVFFLNDRRQLRRKNYKALLSRIGQCETHILIANAYFVPDSKLLKALKKAAKKNVPVKLLLNAGTDVIYVSWAAQVFYTQLLKAGVQIYEYQPSLIHAKYMILDDWAMLGSSNLNHRSLLHDLEVDYHIQNQQTVNLLEKQFCKDLDEANVVPSKSWSSMRTLKMLVGKIVLIFRYWT